MRIGRFHDADIRFDGASRTLIHKDIFHEFEVRHRGLAQVGKSTLFNALTKAGIAAENYSAGWTI
jgi:GTP-binding protein EngB required for normal cell division